MYLFQDVKQADWGHIAIGVVVGIPLALGLIFWYGRAYFKRFDLEDRGEWDRPLPHRFSKDMVIAVYKRKRHNHGRHRDPYRRRRPSQEDPSKGPESPLHK
ncbi:MAG TPA: hypothetical protein VNZ22_21935 [Bacillota bacterium]|nr:hypothetical protein [Bacillota bacterium]